MQRLPIIVIAVTVPMMLFVLLIALSTGLYDVTPMRAPAASAEAEIDAPAEEEVQAAAEAMPAEEDVAAVEAAEDVPAEEAPAAVAAADVAAEVDAEASVEEAVAPAEAADAEAEAGPASASATVDLQTIAAAGDAGAGARLWRQCSACHVADQAQNRVGPHLVDVFGRTVGGVEGFRYSGALEEHGAEIWTAEEMSAWLENPREYAPGTSMSYRGISDAEDRANLLAYLADLQLQSGS